MSSSPCSPEVGHYSCSHLFLESVKFRRNAKVERQKLTAGGLLGSTEEYPGSGISEGTVNPEKLAEGVVDSEVREEESPELIALVAVDSAVEFAALLGVDRAVGGEESGPVDCVATEDRDAAES
jgi:hypothetical protein